MTTEKKDLLLKIYVLVGAVAGLIGTLIGYGILLNQLFQNRLITDAEYIANNMYYEIQNCEQPTYPRTVSETKPVDPVGKTAEEIAVCKQETTARLTDQRSYQMKSDIISGGVRWTLFFLVFLTHLPRLRRQYRKDEE